MRLGVEVRRYPRRIWPPGWRMRLGVVPARPAGTSRSRRLSA